MLAEPPRTPYDLNFRLFGFPIRVHPLFWLGSVLLGANLLQADDGLFLLLIWTAVVFISIVVHELGHAVAFRRYGSNAHIVLWMFGGLAVPYSAIAGRNRRIMVSLAGPLAGFILCGLVYLADELILYRLGLPGLLRFFVWALILVNLYWGILNLLPVFPLDGGQVSRELCGSKWRGQGLRISLQISVWTAGVVAVYSLLCHIDSRGSGGGLTSSLPSWFPRGGLYTAILFALLAVQSYQLLQQVSRGGGYYYEGPDDDRPPWK